MIRNKTKIFGFLDNKTIYTMDSALCVDIVETTYIYLPTLIYISTDVAPRALDMMLGW